MYTHHIRTYLPNNPSLYFYRPSKSRPDVPEYINITRAWPIEGNRAGVPRGLFPLARGIFAEVIIWWIIT